MPCTVKVRLVPLRNWKSSVSPHAEAARVRPRRRRRARRRRRGRRSSPRSCRCRTSRRRWRGRPTTYSSSLGAAPPIAGHADADAGRGGDLGQLVELARRAAGLRPPKPNVLVATTKSPVNCSSKTSRIQSFSDADMTVIAATRATPTISAPPVRAVRFGLRSAFSRASDAGDPDSPAAAHRSP